MRSMRIILCSLFLLASASGIAGEAAEMSLMTEDDLTAQQRLNYNTLILITDEVATESSSSNKAKLYKELLQQSETLASETPDFVYIWILRGEAALQLDRWREGHEAGMNLLRLNYLMTEEGKSSILMAKLNRRGWLEKNPDRIEYNELLRMPDSSSDEELPKEIREEISKIITKLSSDDHWDGYNMLKALKSKMGASEILRYPVARRALAMALPLAASRGGTEMLKAGLASGGNPSSNFGGRSAVFWAAYNGDSSMVRLLLAAGADVNAPDKYGQSVLAEPAWRGASDVVRILTKYGADPNKRGKQKLLVYEAAAKGRHEVVQALIDAGADLRLNSGGDDPAPVLLPAVQSGDAAMVQILINGGADPDAEYKDKDMYWHAKRSNQSDVYGKLKKIMKAGPPEDDK